VVEHFEASAHVSHGSGSYADALLDKAEMDDLKARANELIGYHSEISKVMTAERTSLESRLIPVSAYILVACCEAFHRYPEMTKAIDAAKPAEEIGRAGRRPGVQVNPVYLWSVANFYLVGRKFLTLFQLAEDAVEPTVQVLDFWERAALAFRGDGHRQAWDAGFVVRSYEDDVIATLTGGAAPVGDDLDRIKRFNATLMNYLFLLYFDTRVGTGDSGPYPLEDGTTLLVRDFYRMSQSDFWWSDVAADVPYHNLTAALVLRDVKVKVNDWGTSITDPEDYLDRLERFGLFTTDTADGSLTPVPLDEIDGIVTEVRKAQARHYRNIAAMDRDEKIRCGAYVYFTFLRPFAEMAGIADELDWTVPRDTVGPLYQTLAAIEGANAAPAEDEIYYLPIP
jgi:hypothetical protein